MKNKIRWWVYVIIILLISVVIGFFVLPEEEKGYLIYALLFAIITPLFDGTWLINLWEERSRKKGKNPLL